MSKILTIIFLLFASLPSDAADFRNIMKSPSRDGVMIAVDVASITDQGNGIVELWSREQYSKPQFFAAGPKSIRTEYWTVLFHRRIDCRKRLLMTINVVIRGKSNETLSADAVANPRWQPVVPETSGENVMIWGCYRDYPVS